MAGIQYIRNQYDMPWLKCQMRFNMHGRDGTIIGADGAWLRVRFDDMKSAGRVHPTWQMTYFDKDGNVVKDYKPEWRNW